MQTAIAAAAANSFTLSQGYLDPLAEAPVSQFPAIAQSVLTTTQRATEEQGTDDRRRDLGQPASSTQTTATTDDNINVSEYLNLPQTPAIQTPVSSKQRFWGLSAWDDHLVLINPPPSPYTNAPKSDSQQASSTIKTRMPTISKQPTAQPTITIHDSAASTTSHSQSMSPTERSKPRTKQHQLPPPLRIHNSIKAKP
eukprot:jgi/Hompol1/3631/HPOL_006655-RA